MKLPRYLLLMFSILAIGIISACGSDTAKTEELKLDPKHAELPDFVLATPDMVQETYVMAAQNPDVLDSVPCYCGCGTGAGHESNLDCFVKSMDGDGAVTEYDAHGTAWDICVNIAREAVKMKQDGKGLKEIHESIVEKYSSYGEGTPTPVPTK